MKSNGMFVSSDHDSLQCCRCWKTNWEFPWTTTKKRSETLTNSLNGKECWCMLLSLSIIHTAQKCYSKYVTWIEWLDVKFSLFLNERFVLFYDFAYFHSFHFSVPWSNEQFHSFSHLIREETALSLIKTTALKSLDNKVKIALLGKRD